MQATAEKQISRHELLHELKRAAQVRAIATLLSGMSMLFAASLLGESLGPEGVAVLYFGGSLSVMVLITRFYCRSAVKCPLCGNSLWHCGTGNFKPRRMRIKSDARECSHCHAAFA